MNAYLLLAGIVTAVGLYTIWTRRSDEGGGFGIHLIVGSVLLILIAAGKYLSMFSNVQQSTALVIGLVGLLIFLRINPFDTRRAPFGYSSTTTMILVVVFAISIFFAVQLEMALANGWPAISTSLALASILLFLLQRQALKIVVVPALSTSKLHDEESDSKKSSQT